jgi:hypothetical protein
MCLAVPSMYLYSSVEICGYIFWKVLEAYLIIQLQQFTTIGIFLPYNIWLL